MITNTDRNKIMQQFKNGTNKIEKRVNNFCQANEVNRVQQKGQSIREPCKEKNRLGMFSRKEIFSQQNGMR